MPATTLSMRASFSPPLSASSSWASRSAPRNVVTNLAIDGHAKPGEDGVRMKMYLKIALSTEHLTHSAIPLFPEENAIRILDYAVHPLDSNGTPYAGGPKVNKLLKGASRALQLPPESTKSYLDALVTSPGTSSTSRNSVHRQSAAASASSPPALEVIHTGSITVTNYSVCFVLPKQWPQRLAGESESDEVFSRASTPSSLHRSRRSSVGGERKSFRFMAGIDIWVAYLSMPSMGPYLLSLPVPRCLGNKLKLKIFGPPQPEALAHEDDALRWDLTTDPVVQYKSSGWQSSSRYGHVADDESFSDASETNVSTEGGVVLVQGAFQSTDRLRIRWAQALNDSESIPMDGWRRATCSKVEARLKITVLEVLRPPENPALYDGLRLGVEYSALCKGVFHPTVAARLALDVLLDTKGQTVTWADAAVDSAPNFIGSTWSVRGGAGYIDFDAGGRAPSTPPTLSRRTSASSFDSPSIPGSPAAFDDRPARTRKSSIPVPAGPASLLNVPLPLDNVQDYSFETAAPAHVRSASSMSSSVVSSATGISQMTASASNEQQAISTSGRTTSPATRMAIHLDMDEILPKSRQEGSSFEYSITGAVDIKTKMQPATFSSESSQTDDDPTERVEALLDIPVFRMFGVHDEQVQVIIVSNVPNIVLHSGLESSMRTTSSALRSNGTRRGTRALRVGVPVPSADDGQLSVKLPPMPVTPVVPKREATYSSLGSPVAASATFQPSEVDRMSDSMRFRMPKLEVSTGKAQSGLLTDVEETGRSSMSPSVAGGFELITHVHVTVEPMPSSATQMRAHAVRVRMPAAGIDTSMLEFALNTLPGSSHERPLDVDLVYAAVGGRPVEATVVKGARPQPGAVALSDGADATWIRAHLGGALGSLADVEVVYTVCERKESDSPVDDMHPVVPPEGAPCLAVLPRFYTRVGFMEVDVRRPQGYRIKSVRSNLGNQVADLPTSTTVTRYSLPVSFVPQMTICLVEDSPARTQRPANTLTTILSLLLATVALLLVFSQHGQIQDLHQHLVPQITPRGPFAGHVFASTTQTLSGHAGATTPNNPRTREKRHPEQSDHVERGLSVLQNVRTSLSLRPSEWRALLSVLSPEAAMEALTHLLSRTLTIIRRILHYPLVD